jgi:hypothetical protein
MFDSVNNYVSFRIYLSQKTIGNLKAIITDIETAFYFDALIDLDIEPSKNQPCAKQSTA